MKNPAFRKNVSFVAIFCIASAVAIHAQTYTTLYSFNEPGGVYGQAMVQGINGNLYGTTAFGGVSGADCTGNADPGCGTFFEITPAGAYTTLYQFCSSTNCADGAFPNALTLSSNGNFYGTTSLGGGGVSSPCHTPISVGCGTFFQITPAGKLTTLYKFCSQTNCTDGYSPSVGAPVLGTNGNLYSTTHLGPTKKGGCTSSACGTFFEVTTAGKLTTLHTFCVLSGCPDGSGPEGLILGANGKFYGTTVVTPQVHPYGSIYDVTAGGALTTLYEGAGADLPTVSIQGTDGNFYGTAGGGLYNGGIFFRMTPSGELTTLYNFCSLSNCADGNGPTGVIQSSDGNFYGTTFGGGANTHSYCGEGCGTIFQITATGQLTTLYSFCSQSNCSDGSAPSYPLMQATNGTLFGTTIWGGTASCSPSGCGVIFSLSLGLPAFLEAVPDFATVGKVVSILGNNLTGTTSVTFNGVSAPFKVLSSTYIKAQVPTGATTGTIEVTTPSGVLKSNLGFHVLP